MGCIKAIGCLACLAVLGVAGVLTWRYGPWNDESNAESEPPTLTAANTCEGCCNGLASNCDRAVNEVLFPMVHNAHSSREDLFAGYNNKLGLEAALVAGYRGLMLDSCICDGSLGETLQNWVQGEEDKGENYLGFCHSTCDAGVRDPVEVLGNIRQFLEINANEVLIIDFEINDNSLVELFNAIDQSGLDKYVFRASSTDIEWPTLRSLINSGARVLIFAHGDGMESCKTIDCPEGILYKYDHFEETDWSGGGDVSCDVIGTEREAMDFFLMNHWKNNDADLPSEANAEEINTYDALMARFRACEDRIPNVLAVDFWSLGDVLTFAKEVNQRNAGVAVTAGEKI